MNAAIRPSIFVLTLLMSVGLVFFIRASVKDRTQEVKLVSEQAETSLLDQLQQYLQARSYRVAKVDAEQNSITFEGVVRPSFFLAIFLTLLAAVGFLCLALILSLLFPNLSEIFLGLVLLSPAASIFYWKKASRSEQVLLKVETPNTPQFTRQITVIAHRDELLELQRTLHLKPCE